MDVMSSGLNLSQALFDYSSGTGRADSLVNGLNAAKSKDDESLMDACQDFEAYFIGALFKQMRSSTNLINENSEFFKKSQAEKIFTEMQDEAVAEKMAANGGFGLANYLFMQLQRHNTGIDPAEIE